MLSNPIWAKGVIGDLNFRNISIDEGLSHVTVNTIVQDDQTGVMWLGTTDGLNRYNGYDFTVFKRKSSGNIGLRSNDIRSLHYGPQGDLWIGTYDGLSRYDQVQDQILAVPNMGIADSRKVFSIKTMDDENLILGTDSGLYFFNIRVRFFSLCQILKVGEFIAYYSIHMVRSGYRQPIKACLRKVMRHCHFQIFMK